MLVNHSIPPCAVILKEQRVSVGRDPQSVMVRVENVDWTFTQTVADVDPTAWDGTPAPL